MGVTNIHMSLHDCMPDIMRILQVVSIKQTSMDVSNINMSLHDCMPDIMRMLQEVRSIH